MMRYEVVYYVFWVLGVVGWLSEKEEEEDGDDDDDDENEGLYPTTCDDPSLEYTP